MEPVNEYFKLSTDDELVTYVKLGNRMAFNEIYCRTFKFVYNKVFRDLMDHAETEAVVVNVLTSFWLNREKHKVPGLYAIIDQELQYELTVYFETKRPINLMS